jgi:C_GCAxxG_C_C family probable redox protein
MTRTDDALERFKSGFTCSASVLSVFSDELGLDEKTAKKISCGFGAGISRTGKICGAVSGAVMVIGLKYGKSERGDDAATEKTRSLVREFIREFSEKNGSVNCSRLLGYDLSDPLEFEKARASGLFQTRCFDLVRDSVELLEKIL